MGRRDHNIKNLSDTTVEPTDESGSAVVVVSSSPLSGSSVFEDKTWLDYFEQKLAFSSPLEIKKVEQRIQQAIDGDEDFHTIKENVEEYPLLMSLIADKCQSAGKKSDCTSR
jgi:hypothetical protein